MIFPLFILLFMVLLALAALDFTALHDIRNEYISRDILEYLNISLSGDVPVWTTNEPEWSYLTISLILRVFLYISIFAIGVYLSRKLRSLKLKEQIEK